jgi:hypothetical protein
MRGGNNTELGRCYLVRHTYIGEIPTVRRGRHGRDRMVVGFKLLVQSVHITTNVVRLNPTQERCTQYNIM